MDSVTRQQERDCVKSMIGGLSVQGLPVQGFYAKERRSTTIRDMTSAATGRLGAGALTMTDYFKPLFVDGRRVTEMVTAQLSLRIAWMCVTRLSLF